jgi:hypothetical protein
MSELLRYRNTLATLTLIILFVKDVENFHQKYSKEHKFCEEKKEKGTYSIIQKYSFLQHENFKFN